MPSTDLSMHRATQRHDDVVARASRDDRGLTLVELIVATMLIGILGAIVLSAVTASYRQLRATDDEAAGLADTKVVVERLGRDLRGARGVDAGATDKKLVLWIDYNSDYVRNATSQPDEIVTWAVEQAATGEQYNTLRSTEGGDVKLQADTLVSDIAFCYQSEPEGVCLTTPLSTADAAATKLVTVSLQYDSLENLGTGTRTANFTERLRNVG